jgi:hypothetical protein
MACAMGLLCRGGSGRRGVGDTSNMLSSLSVVRYARKVRVIGSP